MSADDLIRETESFAAGLVETLEPVAEQLARSMRFRRFAWCGFSLRETEDPHVVALGISLDPPDEREDSVVDGEALIMLGAKFPIVHHFDAPVPYKEWLAGRAERSEG